MRRRRHYRRALATGDPRRLRRVLGTVRDREQQVDLAAVLQDDSAPRPPVEVLDREGRRSGLTARLQSQLDARNGPARGRAVLILAHLRLPQGTARLEPMLDDDDPDVRLVAVAGLPLAEDPDAVPALVRALSKRRLAPERVIERLGQPWAVESLLAQLRELDAKGERRAAPRVGVARALGHAGDPRAEPAMIELLRRGSLEERISAARALGAVGGRRSRPELERALTDEAWPLRAQAAKALGAIGVKRAVPALEAVLDDPAWGARRSLPVARRLQRLAPLRAVYASPLDDRLLVIDKENGGKADSLNCGIRYAALPPVLRDRLRHAARPRGARRGSCGPSRPSPRPSPPAAIVRILNGSLLEDGRIKAVQTPEQHARQRADRRVPAGVPGRPRRLVAGQHAADHLRRVRAVPARDGRRGGRLRHQHGRRGRRARRPPAPALPRRQAHDTRSPSSPTRSAGPRRPPSATSCAASATAGSAACWRRCGATRGCSSTRATAASAWWRCRSSWSSRRSARSWRSPAWPTASSASRSAGSIHRSPRCCSASRSPTGSCCPSARC